MAPQQAPGTAILNLCTGQGCSNVSLEAAPHEDHRPTGTSLLGASVAVFAGLAAETVALLIRIRDDTYR